MFDNLESWTLLPLWLRLLFAVFAAGLFLSIYQERRTAGDAALVAVGKTLVDSPIAIFKFIVSLFARPPIVK